MSAFSAAAAITRPPPNGWIGDAHDVFPIHPFAHNIAPRLDTARAPTQFSQK
ncbi:hypothetical protein [Bifidobacterium italicum]|uniref:hypothetical protein n=1 Tax=Bifidobacterium italicum TaxID=1960968 RepID=UPI0012FFC22F|nr:hypothetical protein [Bifidobacterium italicum]